MPWLLPRVVAVVLAMLAGTALGALAGGWLDARAAGMALGGATGVMLAATLDTLRAQRLLAWLRGSQDAQAPVEPGFWGELGYRVERLLRSRDKAIEAERLRLQQFLSAIEASPNGVLLLDGDEQIAWCNSVAAMHFGLDPARDRGQRLTHLVRAPAFVAHLQLGSYDQPVVFTAPPGRQTLSVLVRRYG
ncbi:MAG: phosphate regulon sensor protein PhoR, partial [Gammaproteobacteria bacterium]